MKYAGVVWRSESDKLHSVGTILLWCETLATALATAVDTRKNPRYWDVQVVKLV